MYKAFDTDPGVNLGTLLLRAGPWQDSNPPHPNYEIGALPTELQGQMPASAQNHGRERASTWDR